MSSAEAVFEGVGFPVAAAEVVFDPYEPALGVEVTAAALVLLVFGDLVGLTG